MAARYLSFRDAAGQSRPYTGTDYMLFRLELFEERDDWEMLKSISGPVAQANDALKDEDVRKADRKIQEAKLAAFDDTPARHTLELVCDYVVDRRV